MTDFEELKELASKVKKQRKTHLPEEEFNVATSLAAGALKDTAVDLTALLETLASFPPAVIAETANRSWDEMPPERKAIFVRWIGRREGERAPKRIIYAASRILGHDAGTAIELLGGVLPHNDNLSQEMRGDLRRAFGNDRAADLALLVSPNLNQEVVGRFFRAIFQSIDSQTSFVMKSALAKAAVRVAERRNTADPLFISMVSAIDSQLRSWPTDARDEFAQHVQSVAPALIPHLHLQSLLRVETQSKPTGVEIIGQAVNGVTEHPKSDDSGDKKPRTADIGSWLSQRIRNTKQELDALLKFEQHFQDISSVERLEERLDTVERELQHKSELLAVEIARATELSDKLRHVEDEKRHLESELARRTTELGLAREENGSLGAQITAHSNTAVAEFKNRLGATLSKLIMDLPERAADMDFERSRFLLRQYHQFIDMLESNGIAVRAKKGVA